MALTSINLTQFNANQFAGTIRNSALQVLESAQNTLEKAQIEGRITLAQQVLKGANRVEQLSKALTVLSEKIAPAAPAKRRAKATAKTRAKTAARKPAANAAPKAAAKKTVVKAAPRAKKTAAAV